MFFRCIATLIFAATLLTQTVSAASAPQIAFNVQVVTTKSNDLNDAMKTLKSTSTSGEVVTMSQTVSAGLSDISNTISRDVSSMNSGNSVLSDGDASPIATALTTFATIHGNLQKTITEKHIIFAKYPATPVPILQALQGVEASIDEMFFSIINIIPTRQKEATSAQESVRAAIQKSINTYSASI